jgi:hypothetical protein
MCLRIIVTEYNSPKAKTYHSLRDGLYNYGAIANSEGCATISGDIDELVEIGVGLLIYVPLAES